MLNKDWKKIFMKAWSVRFMLLAALFSALEVGFPMLEGYIDIPHNLFTFVSMFFTAAAFVARFYSQKAFKDDDKTQEGR